jgi:hypothetical protein
MMTLRGRFRFGAGYGIGDPRFAQLVGSVTRSSQLRTRAWHRYAPGDPAPQGGSLSCVTLPHPFRTRAWHRYVREETALAEVRPQSRGGGGERSGVESRWVSSIRSASRIRDALVTVAYPCLAPVRARGSSTARGIAELRDCSSCVSYPCLAPVRSRGDGPRRGWTAESWRPRRGQWRRISLGILDSLSGA